MRAASAALIALLNDNQFVMADLYTITLATGDAFYYADYDADLIVGGNVYQSNNLQISRSGIRTIAGIEVDTLSVDIAADASHTMLGTPFLQIAHNGGLDGARLQVDRVFMPINNPTDTSAGVLALFAGEINVDEIDRGTARLSVLSDIALLNVQMPRNIYQAGCLHTLFDAGCGLSKAAFAAASTVAAGSSQTQINCGLAQAADYFSLGTITFSSGPNAGVSRTVKAYSPGIITLSLPLKAMPTTGDAFTAYPGCDKQQATCTTKFNNLPRFRGFPYIPIPETAI